ncbi:unnamed protein product [Caenorhabditis bovis]|uniref:Transmembrane protein 144 n=1 Tax=Caenorhabditis bovis TaxID=2654633 RepID=A0A8S1FD36_9PELO|nr:unnamed protein product [Caenorhabditis bovis]
MAIGIGLFACAVSSVFFGSMFVTIKNHNSGDGIFAQWLMSMAILIVGFIAYAFMEFPGFYPLAMIGGASWCLGNATAIPIISRLGLAISILIWNTTNCLTGWAGGRFGLFGMKAHVPASPLLNYLGLVCVVIGGFLFSRVKSSPTMPAAKRQSRISLKDVSNAEKEALNSSCSDDELENGDVEVLASNHHEKHRILAIIAALISGFFYGMTFVPVIYMIDNPDKFSGYPVDGLSYVFSHYFGIFLTSTSLFVVYSLIKKNKPYVLPELCLPSLAAGFLWAVAQTSFFVANQNLSQAVTFPIISMVPGCIASAWSVFYFKEIQGRRNLAILGCAMFVTLCGSMLTGLSKTIEL